ncbi:hypothetical protein Z043_109251 [Scleropages formosus]|uniref:CARD domain-containing protein n=1 Tax=Scleropages formosus TaxID=113540 RepID=A0A0P7V9L9_SCLFO|nr:hypothetical protein Z043_109251 [Scleropages formosus]
MESRWDTKVSGPKSQDLLLFQNTRIRQESWLWTGEGRCTNVLLEENPVEEAVEDRNRDDEAGEDVEGQFVDTFMPELIQNVTAVEAIAEALKSKNMIHQEAYSEICALPTSEKKMRKLFEAMRSGGRIVKAKFYKLLMENHPHLVAQLAYIV